MKDPQNPFETLRIEPSSFKCDYRESDRLRDQQTLLLGLARRLHSGESGVVTALDPRVVNILFAENFEIISGILSHENS